MSVAPIARYLLELDAGDEARPPPSLKPIAGKPSTVGMAAMVDEAHAKGFESGKVAAEAQIKAKLEERDALHLRELSSAREAWAQLESGRLAEQLVKGLRELEVRLADTTARILKPFLTAQVHRSAIADLVEGLTVLLTQEKDAAISVAGAADLVEALRGRLDGKLANVTYHPGQVCDVRVTVGKTILETQFGAWMARIEDAVK